MIALSNTAHRYGAVAIILHWMVAILIVGLVGLGFYMTSLPDAGFNKTKIVLVIWHKEYGIIVLLLACMRLAWRVGGALPRLVEGLPEWQKVAARFVHLCFYALMFALPVTGWLMSSASGIPVPFFGLFYLPDLIGHSWRRFHFFVELHHWLAYALVPLIAVHVGAALMHHFRDRDDTLRRMLPPEAA